MPPASYVNCRLILLSSYKYVSLDSRLLILTLVALSGFSPLCLCLSYLSLPMGTKYHKYHPPLMLIALSSYVCAYLDSWLQLHIDTGCIFWALIYCLPSYMTSPYISPLNKSLMLIAIFTIILSYQKVISSSIIHQRIC